MSEFKSNNLREDVQLFLLSTALKDLATELHIFMSSSTQLSGDFKNGRGVRDQTFIRSSKAVADKADVGCIIVRISDEEKATISPLIEALGLPMPTHVIDVYKNRRSRYNQVKIWSVIDLGTCRENDILITTGDYEEIKDFKEIPKRCLQAVSLLSTYLSYFFLQSGYLYLKKYGYLSRRILL